MFNCINGFSYFKEDEVNIEKPDVKKIFIEEEFSNPNKLTEIRILDRFERNWDTLHENHSLQILNPIIFRASSEISIENFYLAAKIMLHKHQTLRCAIRTKENPDGTNDRYFYEMNILEPDFGYYDLPWEEVVPYEQKKRMDSHNGPLWRIRLCLTTENEIDKTNDIYRYVVLGIFHHAIIDGVSRQQFWNEFLFLLQVITINNEQYKLFNGISSFVPTCFTIRAFHALKKVPKIGEFCTGLLNKFVVPFCNPYTYYFDEKELDETSSQARTSVIPIWVSEELTKKILALSKQKKSSVNSLLTSVAGSALLATVTDICNNKYSHNNINYDIIEPIGVIDRKNSYKYYNNESHNDNVKSFLKENVKYHKLLSSKILCFQAISMRRWEKIEEKVEKKKSSRRIMDIEDKCLEKNSSRSVDKKNDTLLSPKKNRKQNFDTILEDKSPENLDVFDERPVLQVNRIFDRSTCIGTNTTSNFQASNFQINQCKNSLNGSYVSDSNINSINANNANINHHVYNTVMESSKIDYENNQNFNLQNLNTQHLHNDQNLMENLTSNSTTSNFEDFDETISPLSSKNKPDNSSKTIYETEQKLTEEDQKIIKIGTKIRRPISSFLKKRNYKSKLPESTLVSLGSYAVLSPLLFTVKNFKYQNTNPKNELWNQSLEISDLIKNQVERNDEGINASSSWQIMTEYISYLASKNQLDDIKLLACQKQRLSCFLMSNTGLWRVSFKKKNYVKKNEKSVIGPHFDQNGMKLKKKSVEEDSPSKIKIEKNNELITKKTENFSQLVFTPTKNKKLEFIERKVEKQNGITIRNIEDKKENIEILEKKKEYVEIKIDNVDKNVVELEGRVETMEIQLNEIEKKKKNSILNNNNTTVDTLNSSNNNSLKNTSSNNTSNNLQKKNRNSDTNSSLRSLSEREWNLDNLDFDVSEFEVLSPPVVSVRAFDDIDQLMHQKIILTPKRSLSRASYTSSCNNNAIENEMDELIDELIKLTGQKNKRKITLESSWSFVTQHAAGNSAFAHNIVTINNRICWSLQYHTQISNRVIAMTYALNILDLIQKSVQE